METYLTISLKISELRWSSLAFLSNFWTSLVVAGLLSEMFIVWRDWRLERDDFFRGTIHTSENPGVSQLIWGLCGALLVAVGVAGELWVNVKAVRIEQDISSDTDSLVSIIRGRAAEANVRAATNEREAARLNKLAEDEHGALLKLQSKVAWRILFSEQRQRIATKLRAFQGQGFSIIELPEDLEIDGIGDDILKTLTGRRMAGWNKMAFARMPDPHRRMVSGVLVEVRADANQTSWNAARALSSALNAEGIVTSIPQRRDDNNRVFVGIISDGRNGPSIDDLSPITITVGQRPRPGD